jgi:hypothetical protein
MFIVSLLYPSDAPVNSGFLNLNNCPYLFCTLSQVRRSSLPVHQQ